jgi:transketolase
MSLPPAPLHWTRTDERAVDTLRLLALDAVEQAGNGHPGTAMSLAPAAYLLFQRHLRHDPADPHWAGRDRFVLSAGHSSLTLYLQLYLSGYPLTLDDLRALRTWGSATPGHPEWRHTPGVETTTGPLGQGVGNAVGMAMDARRVRGLLDPDAPAGESPFDHVVYVLASDGDMQEGVAAEASSLAGTQQLGNLVVVWDDNRISIEDDTSVAFTEDVCRRYEAYGWHVQRVDWTGPDGYHEDVAALDAALTQARAVTDRPSFVALRTIIGWPAPTKRDTGGIHGSKAGAQEVAATKQLLGFDPQQSFVVEPHVLAHARQVADRGAQARRAWDDSLAAWRRTHPQRGALLDRLVARRLPSGWESDLPDYTAERGTGAVATRVASGAVLTAVARHLPELWGGSADLAGSNNTSPRGEPSFLPPQRSSKAFTGNWYGRVLHFGVREHAMGAVLNGIALGGLTRPYGGTFLVFSDYMRPSVRLAALMGLPVTYVWTHDSIGLGEDGPTHQPVEQLAALRAIPGLAVVRPADAVETVGAWTALLRRHSGPPHSAPLPADDPAATGAVGRAPVPGGPVGLALTRQDVPVLLGSDAAAVDRGGYVLADSPTDRIDVVLVATGSEVALAVEAAQALRADGVGARVVSMPCLEWFAEQPASYRDSVLPPQVRGRVSVEAGIAAPWAALVGDHGRSVSLEHFGASADYRTLYREFGLTADAVVEAARDSLASAPERTSS